MKIKKAGYMVLGFVGLALGAVGAVVPLLPAFPFLLLAAFGFAKSSQKLHNWFIGTKLYRENLESFDFDLTQDDIHALDTMPTMAFSGLEPDHVSF